MNSDWAPWALTVAGALAYDAALIRGGQRSLSERAGRHPAGTLIILALFACHFLGRPRRLARLDPLRFAANLIRRPA